MFILDCKKRVEKNKLAARTLADYEDNMLSLKPYFGNMMPAEVAKIAVGKFRDLGVECDRAVRVNRERACLSACFS